MIGFIVFLLFFLIIYGLMNYLFYRYYKRTFNKCRKLVFIYSLLQTFLPIIWRVLDRTGYTSVSPPLALISLVWMGFIVYFLISLFIFRIASIFIDSVYKNLFILCFISGIILSAYSYTETLTLENHHYIINTEKIPNGKILRILHISDLHLGPLMREDKVNLVKEAFKRYKPDIVAVTGDFVDGNMKDLMHLADMFHDIDPPLGKFAVMGNHEFYVGYKQAITFMERAGFRVLRGEHVDLGYIVMAGVDDDEGLRRNYEAFTDEREALKGADTSKFVVMLKHKPIINKDTVCFIDIQLSGHTHGGVLFFIGYFILNFMFETNRGIKEIGENKYIVVSKGIGTGGPPMRLLSPPDIIVIDIVGTSKSKRKLR